MLIKKKRSLASHGFTVVELLVVIVVIAILAAVSVVAFNGVKQRADDARLASEAKSWLPAIQSYQTLKGVYPERGHATIATCLIQISPCQPPRMCRQIRA